MTGGKKRDNNFVLGWTLSALAIAKHISYAIMALFFISVICVFSVSAQDSADHLVINEIYPAPFSGEKEWVEIYNPTLVDFDLSDFCLKDGAIATKNLSGMILAGEYFIFEVSSSWLNNSGEILRLIHNPSLGVIDQVAYGNWDDGSVDPDDNAQAPAQGQSISRIPNGQDTDIDRDDFRITAPTQAKENILPVFPSGVCINEIIPQPATGTDDEFIELYNFSDETIDLSGWQIDDSEGGSKPFLIPQSTFLIPGEYLVFQKSLTRISLNDSGDSVRLIDPNGDIKYQVPAYQKAIRGLSYSKFGDTWKWTTEITPKGENIFREEIILPDEDLLVEEMLISQVRELPIEETVKVIGVVSVLPGKLSSQYFYIEDESGGIQIYSYHKSFPFLRLGDVVSIVGELAEYKNERRIKISSESDIQITSSRSPPEAKKIKIDEINERLEGRYISVTGTVTKTSGNVFYIHGSGEIQVSIREGTGIKKPKMRVGDRVEIAGILSQYGDYYRILPTRQDDVKIIKSLSLAKSGMNLYLSLLITGLIFFLWNIFQKVKKRLQRLPQV